MPSLPRNAVVTGALLMVALSPPAEAAELADHGLEIGLRTGVSFPVGDAASASKLSESLGVQFPLWLDLGYRFGAVVVGAYGEWTPGLLGSQVDCGNESCSASGWRAGLEVQIHPVGRLKTVDPWVSLGFGYAWDTLRVSSSSLDPRQAGGSVTVHGWDIARIGIGVDFPLTPWLRIGPFVHATVSEYVEGSATFDNNTYATPIEQKAVHSWITIGVKVTGLL